MATQETQQQILIIEAVGEEVQDFMWCLFAIACTGFVIGALFGVFDKKG